MTQLGGEELALQAKEEVRLRDLLEKLYSKKTSESFGMDVMPPELVVKVLGDGDPLARAVRLCLPEAWSNDELLLVTLTRYTGYSEYTVTSQWEEFALCVEAREWYQYFVTLDELLEWMLSNIL